MCNRFLILICSIAFSSNVIAQNDVTAAGNTYISNNMKLSFSLGESIISNYTNNQVSTTNGVIQPIAENSGVLSVEELSFSAYREADHISIDWHLNDEGNILEYILERKLNKELSFFPIMTKAASDISTFKGHEYLDKDIQVLGYYYYRLKIVRNDNSFSFTDIRSVLIEDLGNSELNVFPNPTFSTLHIEGIDIKDLSYCLLRLNGEKVSFGNIYDGLLDVSQLAAGLYIFQIKSADRVYNKKILKLNFK